MGTLPKFDDSIAFGGNTDWWCLALAIATRTLIVLSCSIGRTYFDAKQEPVGVRSDTLRHHGAVSDDVRSSRADLAVLVTGNAGPEGGSGVDESFLFVSGRWRIRGSTGKKVLLAGAIEPVR